MATTVSEMFSVNLLDAKQHIESVQWRIQRRADLGSVEMDEDASDNDFRSVADIAQIQAGFHFPELQVQRKPGGRVIVREAAFGKPIIEFTPIRVD